MNERDAFWIYRNSTSKENHAVWSNWMPANAKQMMKLSLGDKSNPAKGETAVRVDIDFTNPFWCGVAVSSKEDY